MEKNLGSVGVGIAEVSMEIKTQLQEQCKREKQK